MSRFSEADRLLRLLVRQRGSCERCGGAGSQVAHIVRRGYAATRCDERNVWWLCGGPGSGDCHAIVDQNHDEHDLLVRWSIGHAALAELKARAEAGPCEPLSLFWKSETARLRQLCAERSIPTRRSVA